VIETEVDFTSGTQELVGTLTRPDNEPPYGAALLLPGSGPLDRDANYRRMRFDTSRQLAHSLVNFGIATLRYDKRGVGKSPGDWRAAGLYDNVDDADAAISYLTSQSDLRRGVAIVGHSEGAVLAAAVAAKRTDIAALVLLAGAARPGREVLLWQAERIMPSLPAPVRLVLKVLKADPVAKVAANHRKILATTADVSRLGGARINAKWFREYLTHDPADDLSKYQGPVLAITGEKDLQVDPADLSRIKEVAGGPVTAHAISDLTHTLRLQTHSPDLRKYRAEVKEPLDELTLLPLVGSWIAERLRERG
jgi:pimeloyl-ACP methyl ester carboxylesterase